MPTQKLTPEIITAAIQGFEYQKTQIDNQIAGLRAILSGGSVESALAAPEAVPGTRKKLSTSARKRMSEAQQLRWAKVRGEAKPESPTPTDAPKAKRKLSAAAKAKLVANLKKARAAKAAKAKSVATKETAPVRKKAAKKAAAAETA